MKISKFWEFLQDKKTIGVPIRKIRSDEYKFNTEIDIVEKWPLAQAYGLDVVGSGFFTMKH